MKNKLLISIGASIGFSYFITGLISLIQYIQNLLDQGGNSSSSFMSFFNTQETNRFYWMLLFFILLLLFHVFEIQNKMKRNKEKLS